ncbi:uncharacterized protein K02A2.6-like [Macrosteles quadrilineatus]|uniref:uncharacterized protein K02A2.6-like n=1 Tax=Macrosteles quadrilineatus TaxID=74068 RepID=UPI0023E0B99E|nr:uncharacterized protein K02A2.6-like [Macrosteles quadrilineatus]
MNSEQFDKFIESQKQQMDLLFLLFEKLEQKMKDNTPDPTAQFESYNSEKERFSAYIERFENYLSMKNVSNKTKKAQILCASIGSIHYNNLVAFKGPTKKIKDLEYEQLVEAFGEMLSPKKNTVVSQHYFFSTYQSESENIPDYVASLQKQLADCEFYIKCECRENISTAHIFLRAQFIRGIRDNSIREQLLQGKEENFDEIVRRAIALEAAQIQCKELSNISKPLIPSSSVPDIMKIQKTTRHDHPSTRTSSSSSSTSSPWKKPSYKHRSSQRIDYESLGINNLCFRCGTSNHRSNQCRIRREKLFCEACKKNGHIQKVCINTLTKKYASSKQVNRFSDNDMINDSQSDCSYGACNIISSVSKDQKIINLYEIEPGHGKYIVEVAINHKKLKMEVDSGARYTILPEDKFLALNLGIDLQPSNLNFRAYFNDIVPCKGKAKVTLQYKERSLKAEVYVVSSGHDPILGRDLIRAFDIELKQIDHDMKTNPKVHLVDGDRKNFQDMNNILNEFASIFEEKIGCVPNIQVSLTLRDDTKPVFTKERDVPYALRERVEKELESLEKEGIITPIATSDWRSPLVIIPKPDGGLRLCVDYKCGVNERLVSANFPIRTVEDVLNSLRNSKYFCKLDLYKAYLHLAVDKESSEIQTMSTHKGTFLMNRLSFGIKTAPSEFNRILSQILNGLNKCEAYFDDIVVHGATQAECAHNLRMCLRRLTEYDLHLNRKKCTFFETKIEYLGHLIEQNKISKSPEKIKAVMEMSRPHNADEVRRFLGMITYYSRFIPNLSTLSCPLRELLKKKHRFQWTTECESSFQKLKQEICSDRVLIPYDPKLPVVLSCDASPVGIAGILSHIVNGHERPIAYTSRSLTPAEQNYNQLDREALAIIFSVGKFHNYLYGSQFTLVTDNKPLSRIFSHDHSLPKMTTARLLRYASFLSGFNYKLKNKSGDENENADCLSRAPLSQDSRSTDMKINEEVHLLYAESLFQISSTAITNQTIASATLNDSHLKSLMKTLQTSNEDTPYTLLDGILFWQDRVVIPQSLKNSILRELHTTHIGITKMKQLARRYVYWEGMNHDIEDLVRSCEICAKLRNNPPKVIVHPWDQPHSNWERLHIDYAGPFEGHHFLIAIDAKSKWAEVRVMRHSPTTETTIHTLQEIFSFHGYPNSLVTDNASIFTSDVFKAFCIDHGITQKFIAPGHPATNGLAERNVQTVKKRLKSMASEKGTMPEKVRKMLLRYRATPLACGKSPAELYLHRRLRIELDAIFPIPKKINKEKEVRQTKHVRSMRVGDRAQVRLYSGNAEIWEFGTIQSKLGYRHYMVKLDSGRLIKRHINQLIRTRVPPKTTNQREEDNQRRSTNQQSKDIQRRTVRFNIPGIPALQRSTNSGSTIVGRTLQRRSTTGQIPVVEAQHPECGIHFPDEVRIQDQSPRRSSTGQIPVVEAQHPECDIQIPDEVESPQLRRSTRVRQPPSYLEAYV